MKEDQEFWIALIIWGGIISMGLLVSVALGFIAIALKKAVNKKSIIKDLYGERERKNGQHKGGARGKF